VLAAHESVVIPAALKGTDDSVPSASMNTISMVMPMAASGPSVTKRMFADTWWIVRPRRILEELSSPLGLMAGDDYRSGQRSRRVIIVCGLVAPVTELAVETTEGRNA
jgi:hypothetical protein